MFPEDFLGKVIRATIVGGIGTILGAIVGGIIFGILAALLVAGLSAVFQAPSYRSSNEISAILAFLSGFGGAFWGAGIGGVAGLLTGILLVVLEPARPAKTVYIPSNTSDLSADRSNPSGLVRPSSRPNTVEKRSAETIARGNQCPRCKSKTYQRNMGEASKGYKRMKCLECLYDYDVHS